MSDIGTFMQSVGAAWLMISLGAGPMYVALTSTASSLPFFVLALPAGAIGDIVDRRKLVLVTEWWMVGVSLVLAIVTISGHMTPWLLLALTFALSAGDAFETPTWRAILPELVGHEDLAAASALNGIEFNLARAVGPALAGLLIASAGVSAAFLFNVASFFGVLWVIYRWQRAARVLTTPKETVFGATVAAVRYVHYSPAIRLLVFRAGAVMFCASGLMALLPSVAHSVNDSASAYGLVLGCFGIGAVLGALLMQRARSIFSAEAVASTGLAIVGVSTIVAGMMHALPALCALMIVAGGAWIVFISLASALVQTLAPDWVRARVLAVYLLVFQGGIALGGVVWGALAQRTSLGNALMWSGLATVASIVLGRLAPLPAATVDVSPWNHWRMPAPVDEVLPELDDAPVLVTVEYHVESENVLAFEVAALELARIRRRDGASTWDVVRDIERPDIYIERFEVSSWAEHLRQHDRATQSDRDVEARVSALVHGSPIVKHWIRVVSD